MKKVFGILLIFTLLLVGCSTPTDTAYTQIVGDVSIVTGNSTDHVDIEQNVIADPNNSSTTNLASGANFTGTATDTLGIADIQVSLKTDQNCDVYIEQSPDGTNWDIVDQHSYLWTLGGDSWDTKAVNSHVRVIVVNANGSATTYFRLQTALLPIGEPLPRSLTDKGRLKVESTITDDYGNELEITPKEEMKIAQSVKISGGLFVGTIVDPNFWSTNTSANGSVYQAARTATTGGEAILTTNTTANGAARLSSIRRGRYIAGNSNQATIHVHLPDAGTTNNTRRWGLADYTTITSITDGAYFQLSGTTFSVVTMRGGTANTTSSGSFNGEYGTEYPFDVNTTHRYEIYYTTYKVDFSIDGIKVHSVPLSASPWTNSVNMYLYMDNVNSGGSTSNVLMHVRSASIHRLGPTFSSPKYSYITTATTSILKYTAGTLMTITIGTPTNSTITIYDNTSASGQVIALISMGNNTFPMTLQYGLDFYNGLTIVSSGSASFTVMYE